MDFPPLPSGEGLPPFALSLSKGNPRTLLLPSALSAVNPLSPTPSFLRRNVTPYPDTGQESILSLSTAIPSPVGRGPPPVRPEPVEGQPHQNNRLSPPNRHSRQWPTPSFRRRPESSDPPRRYVAPLTIHIPNTQNTPPPLCALCDLCGESSPPLRPPRSLR